MTQKKLKIVDLFAGLGGIRIGFTQAAQRHGFLVDCVFTSEIKPHAVRTLEKNFPGEKISGDITAILPCDIPDHDFLLAGFPCQPFSHAGKREGFSDTRGTLFFTIEKILETKQPQGFILENVEGLVTHDKAYQKDPVGRTLATILAKLELLGYHTSYKIFNSVDFGLPQSRKRIYIVGTKTSLTDLEAIPTVAQGKLNAVIQKGQPVDHGRFAKTLLSFYTPSQLVGKQIKDKRGGEGNIHSWDIDLKGKTTPQQRKLLNKIVTERRKKYWAKQKNIVWSDGMPLTFKNIETFADEQGTVLKNMLDDLTAKGYLKEEHPKNVIPVTSPSGMVSKKRLPDLSKEKGYNIVAGKFSFPYSAILDPEKPAPTLVASDAHRLGVIDGDGIRHLTAREGLRLFGFPENYTIDETIKKTFDLLGNSVTVPVVEAVANQMLTTLYQ